MKFHETSQCNGYCGREEKEEEGIKRHKKRREYELMLIRRFNLKKEIRLLQRNFAANELNIKDYEVDEETKEFACEVRERVWENRTRKNWDSDTSFDNEHLELGYYVLTQHERELAVVALSDTESVMENNFHRLLKLGASPTQDAIV